MCFKRDEVLCPTSCLLWCPCTRSHSSSHSSCRNAGTETPWGFLVLIYPPGRSPGSSDLLSLLHFASPHINPRNVKGNRNESSGSANPKYQRAQISSPTLRASSLLQWFHQLGIITQNYDVIPTEIQIFSFPSSQLELTPDVFQLSASVNETVSMWKYAWITHCGLFIRRQFGGCCLQLATWSLSALFLALRKLCLWIQPFRYLDGLFNYTTGPVCARGTGVSEILTILNTHFLCQRQELISRISCPMCPLESITLRRRSLSAQGG